MTRAALVDSSSNVVVNTIVLGGGYEPPSGITVVVSDTASIGDTYENGTFISPATVPDEPPGPPTKDEYDQLVNAERDRRIAMGITVEVSPGRVVPVDTRGARDLLNIGGLAQVAKARVDAADTTPVYFRGSDNITYELKPEEMWVLASSSGVAGHIQACYLKAWALKDAAEMVKDVTADELWK
jgi:hypothetical protein